MIWKEIRKTYPHKWLLVEALKASTKSGKREIEDLSVIETFENSTKALKQYKELHVDAPERELYVFHTDNDQLNVEDKTWHGIRGRV